jgi:hypothetical protein
MKKKTVKSIIIIITILLIVLITMGVTDYRRTIHNFEKPLFARLNVDTAEKDGGSGTYNGIGYFVDIQGNFMPEDEFEGVTHARFYVFGKELRHAIRD